MSRSPTHLAALKQPWLLAHHALLSPVNNLWKITTMGGYCQTLLWLNTWWYQCQVHRNANDMKCSTYDVLREYTNDIITSRGDRRDSGKAVSKVPSKSKLTHFFRGNFKPTLYRVPGGPAHYFRIDLSQTHKGPALAGASPLSPPHPSHGDRRISDFCTAIGGELCPERGKDSTRSPHMETALMGFLDRACGMLEPVTSDDGGHVIKQMGDFRNYPCPKSDRWVHFGTTKGRMSIRLGNAKETSGDIARWLHKTGWQESSSGTSIFSSLMS